MFHNTVQRNHYGEVEVVLEICPLAALPRGEARRVEADPPIAVFHTDDGEVFAIDDTCTHQDASLADGWLEGCEIECPLHASRFDLRTGAVDAPPAKLPVRTHEVVIVDGVINVVLDDAPPNLPPGVATRAAGEAAP
jgi:3-phenylpropionate/trans-cinnamate dioxygenase ferredoxin component